MKMNNELRAELERLGWDPDNVRIWGRRVAGCPSSVTLVTPDGETRHYFAPCTTVQGGDQVAVVR